MMINGTTPAYIIDNTLFYKYIYILASISATQAGPQLGIVGFVSHGDYTHKQEPAPPLQKGIVWQHYPT